MNIDYNKSLIEFDFQINPFYLYSRFKNNISDFIQSSEIIVILL